MPLNILACSFVFFGTLVTILFWIPKVVNRRQLKEFFGRRYALIYIFYFTNGPFLMITGIYFLWFQNP